jgi:hypothetical protein
VASNDLKMLRKQYISPLRKYLKIVEINLSNKSYDKIEYSAVPSVAMNKYRKTFVCHDTIRFMDYLENVKIGNVKINAKQIYPHDLVRHYLNGGGYDIVVEEQWKCIIKEVRDKQLFKGAELICDVSGSMHGTPLEVSIAMGLLGMDEGRRRIITFSENPEIHIVVGNTLMEQVNSLKNMKWGGNTDFNKVILLIHKLMYWGDDIKKIYIFSDMQFDNAFTGLSSYDTMKQLLGDYMPNIIFWNLRGNTKDFPTTMYDNNVVLLSGYSQSLLSYILNATDINPLNIMLSIIRNERYNRLI